MHDEVRPEFLVTDCKKCKTKQLAFSWDVDLASMVRALGQPYQSLYMAAYALPKSACPRDGDVSVLSRAELRNTRREEYR